MSDIVLAPKPIPGALAARLAVSRDRAAEKVAIHLEQPMPRPFNYQGIEITVLNRRRVVIEKPGSVSHGVEVWVEARRNGVILPIDPHLRWFPPPLMVPDGTHREEVIDGETVTVANHREDPAAAFVEIVGQAVMGQLK